MITFHVETLKDAAEEIRALAEAHYQETEFQYQGVPAKSDDAQYWAWDNAGALVIYTARNDGRLIGHICFLLHRSRHTSRRAASEEFFYIVPDERRGTLAMRLLKFACADLRRVGYEEIVVSRKHTGPDIEPLLTRCGFRPITTLYYLES